MEPLLASRDTVEVVKALAWPVAALLGLIVIMISGQGQRLTAYLEARLRKVEAFGISVELDEKLARETRQSVEQAFGVLRTRIGREFDSAVRYHSLEDRLVTLIDFSRETLRQHNSGSEPEGLRSTIYVKDVLVSTSLYQLLDYYPKSRGPRGRTVSRRFGIVGKAWRSQRPEAEASVPEEVEVLIREWGMTRDEAKDAGKDRRSFLAIPFKHQGVSVGVLYLDAPKENAFGDNSVNSEKKEAIVAALTQAAEDVYLGPTLLALTKEVQRRAPGINLGE